MEFWRDIFFIRISLVRTTRMKLEKSPPCAGKENEILISAGIVLSHFLLPFSDLALCQNFVEQEQCKIYRRENYLDRRMRTSSPDRSAQTT